MVALTQLVYASRPFGFDAQILSLILLTARDHNPRFDITGALIVRGDLYLQLLEGPPAAIDVLYARIERDDRHLEVRKLLHRAVDSRMFPDWAMRDDPAKSWLWTQDEVDTGALDRASEAEILAVFARVKNEAA